MSTYTARHYAIAPDAEVDLRDTEPVNPPSLTKHYHVVVTCPDGTEIWLDIDTAQADHNYVDIRQFNRSGALKGQGMFTIVNGARGKLDRPLHDTEGVAVTGHGWDGGYVVTLLVDKDGEEAAARMPSNGNG